jgi:hypothetical protein
MGSNPRVMGSGTPEKEPQVDVGMHWLSLSSSLLEACIEEDEEGGKSLGKLISKFKEEDESGSSTVYQRRSPARWRGLQWCGRWSSSCIAWGWR